MRHLKAGNRLGKTTSHRRAMMRNMVTSILENGQITCTLARAKEVRKPLEKMISWGKRGDLHARRLALRFVKSKKAMSNLFEELPERYRDRHGGYSRIIKLGKRRLGDNSEMAIVQLLGCELDTLSSLKKSKSSKKIKLNKKDSSILKEVSKEVTSKADEVKSENSQTPEKPQNDKTNGVVANAEKNETPEKVKSENSQTPEKPQNDKTNGESDTGK